MKAQAEAEGLDRVFLAAGFDWREPGCSMCLAMNPDKLAPGERSASTSNRNFEGRQGRGGRTHLVSPAVAAATAVAGNFATPEDLVAGAMEPVRIVTGTAVPARPLRRRHRPDHPRRVAQAGRAHRLRAGPVLSWRDDRTFVLNDERYAGARSWSPGPTSAPARPASTRCGRSWTTASGPWSRPASATSSATTPPRTAWCRCVSAEVGRARCCDAVEADPTLEITIDVERRTRRAPALGIEVRVPARRRHPHRFLEGLDDIGITLRTPTPSTPTSSTAPAWQI